METLLIGVTVVSLGVALAMSVVAWRAAQDEKRRAAARVAALATAAQVPDSPFVPGSPAPDRRADSPWRSPANAGAAGALSSSGAGDIPRPWAVPVPPPVEVPAAGAVSVQAGFLGAEPTVRESSLHQRWLATAAAILAVVLGGFVYARMSVTHGQAVATQQQAAASPLELLSLRHEREGVNLSVAGLVRNPTSGPVVERVTAMVYLFDQQGTFVTSAKAPIDFLKLTAGDESPFVVKVAAPQSVARYRVSFRTDEGTLPHVDRRGESPVAAPVSLAGR